MVINQFSSFISRVVFVSCVLLTSAETYAACSAVRYDTRPTNVNQANYVEPGAGDFKTWTGPGDYQGSSGGLPTSININSAAFQPPGTLIASGSMPFINLGISQGYYVSPEQVLYRCAPEDGNDLWELYGTRGNSYYSGMTPIGDADGIADAYRTGFKNVALRVTNSITGEHYTNYWKGRKLTDLDRDSKGYYLVKVKNFSGMITELFAVSDSTGLSNSGVMTVGFASAQIVFHGGGITPGMAAGNPYAVYQSAFADWPGSLQLYQKVTATRAATCTVTNATPSVTFPGMSVSELNAGGQRSMPVTIQFACQTGAPATTGLTALVSGTAAGQTAIGVLVPPENYQSAVNLGLKTSGNGVTYLISNGYGTSDDIAQGVGVTLSQSNGAGMNFLSNQFITTGGNADGWYPVLSGSSANGSVNGVTNYTSVLNATFKKIPGVAVTTGHFNATAQVVIRIQ